uniref:Uncharacterized protein n=1 Tax=Anguilla anguilla TaxID=7936 RepID=A0A0E9TH52_ANGAN
MFACLGVCISLLSSDPPTGQAGAQGLHAEVAQAMSSSGPTLRGLGCELWYEQKHVGGFWGTL